MPQSANLTRIGSRIKIDLDKVQDRISSNLIKKIYSDPRATVTDYKMTDGGGVGLVVKLADGTKNWFFENEIGPS
ncbi:MULTISPECIES: cytochrome b6f subunit PetP [Prochlorococcus]|nr:MULTISPECIES: DUF2862 domain-containing protein [Prochlorococcus]KGG11260.1 hypothetical protein EV04_1336 [Prochlorococcus marinus str. LG]KGG21599.1 hypothetical protein EV08_0688 [Prochlorococcus marinus str. SS2]KGG23059.1 hypothetical protein EV09_1804 [Prochlorococcus marinus str. SS35]KGG33766.1 hypothetical protein EV10_0203 [Prochlorococcus marinus str. SS51]KGG36883.1 hypothetical protein EV11_0667 [Prochlorococcus sp. SS52]